MSLYNYLKKILLIALLYQSAVYCSGTWTWQCPFPQGNSLKGVSFPDTLHGWAVGDNGVIISTSDGGKNWSFSQVEGNIHLKSVHFNDSLRGWICGYNGYIAETNDGGKSWIERRVTTDPVNRIFFVNKLTGFIIADAGFVLRTRDGGVSWDSIHVKVPIRCIHFLDENTGWIGISREIYSTTDGGDTWQQLSSIGFNVIEIRFFNEKIGWIMGDSYDNVYHTKDGGLTWENVWNDGGHLTIRGTIEIADSMLFIGGYAGTYRTRADTCNFLEMLPEKTGKITSFSFPTKGRGYGVGINGKIIKINTFKDSLTLLSTNADCNFYDICFTTPSEGWVVGSGNSLFHTLDKGNVWQAVSISLPGVYSFPSVSFSDPDNGWIAGNNAGSGPVVLHSENRGKDWIIKNLQSDSKINDIWFVSNKTGLVAGTKGMMLRTDDGGNTWKNVNPDTASLKSLNRIFFINETTGWVTGDSGLILKTSDGGISWKVQNTTATWPLFDIQFLNENEGWCFGDRTNTNFFPLFHTTDGGENWVQTKNFLNIVGVNTFFFSDTQYGWAAGEYSTLLSTTDRGETWTSHPKFQSNKVQKMLFTDNGTGWAVGDGGTILRYHDSLLANNIIADRKNNGRNSGYRNAFFTNGRSGRFLNFCLDFSGPVKIQLYDLSGKLCYTADFYSQKNKWQSHALKNLRNKNSVIVALVTDYKSGKHLLQKSMILH